MALRYREEIVGKRFLCAYNRGKLQLTSIAEWQWRNGIIRSASHTDTTHEDLSILVEFDDADWKRRKWIHVYKNKFQVFFVENTLVWTPRKDPFNTNRPDKILWPAFSFKSLVDIPDVNKSKLRPVECLVDGARLFLDYDRLTPYQDGDELTYESALEYNDVRKGIRQWIEQQDGQGMLLTTPSVLSGCRVEVYRVEGTTQWFTAVIGSYNDTTRELTLTDDTVLEVHNEDPSLVQIRLIGDGVVESIRKGGNVGVTPRRRTCTLNNQQGVRNSRTMTHLFLPTTDLRMDDSWRRVGEQGSTSEQSEPLTQAGAAPFYLQNHYTRSTRSHSQSPQGGGNTTANNNAKSSKKSNKRSADNNDDDERGSEKSRVSQERKRKTSENSDILDVSQKNDQGNKKSKIDEGKKQRNKRNSPTTTTTKGDNKEREIDKEATSNARAMADEVRQSDALNEIVSDVKVNEVIKANVDDHCSDSGISDKFIVRSSDERSTSRSSESSRHSDDRAIGRNSDEHGEMRSAIKLEECVRPRASPAASPLTFDRNEPVHVWRDPKLVKNEKNTVRHVHSVQHSSVAPHLGDAQFLVSSSSSSSSTLVRPSYPNAVAAAHPAAAYSATDDVWRQHKFGAPISQPWNPVGPGGEPVQIKRERDDHVRDRERRDQQREAVEQHFEESLRLANQKKASLAMNQVRDLSVKNNITNVNPHRNALQHAEKVGVEQKDNMSRFSARSMDPRSMDPREGIPSQSRAIYSEDGQKKHETDPWMPSRYSQLPPQMYHNPELRMQQQTDYKGMSNVVPEPANTVGSLMLPKSEPSFNLYGYQPFQLSYISQDKLSIQAKPRPSSSEHVQHHPSNFSAQSSASPGYRHLPLPSPPPLMPSHDSRPTVYPQTKTSAVSYPLTISPKQQMKERHQTGQPVPASSLIGGPMKGNYEVDRAHHYSKEQWPGMQMVSSKANVAVQQPSAVVSVTTIPYSNHVYTNATVAGTTKATSVQSIGQSSQPPVALIQQGLVPNPMYNLMGHSSVAKPGHGIEAVRMPTAASPIIPVRGVKPPTMAGEPSVRIQEQCYKEPNHFRMNAHEMTHGSTPNYINRPMPETNRGIKEPHVMNVQNYASPAVSMQTQPLNLEVPNRQRSNVACNDAMKRKAAKECANRKKPKTRESESMVANQGVGVNPVLSRVSAPTPLVSGGVTTITTVVNTVAFNPSVQNGSVVQVSSSNSTDVMTSSVRSVDSLKCSSAPLVSAVPWRTSTADKPGVPVTCHQQETDQRASPSVGSSNYGSHVTKLKKTWLQRHSDEDSNNNQTKNNSSSNSNIVNIVNNGIVDNNEKTVGLNCVSPVVTSSCSSTISSRSMQYKDSKEDIAPSALINGHFNDNMALLTDESTNSASESEMHMERENYELANAQMAVKKIKKEHWDQVTKEKSDDGDGESKMECSVNEPKKKRGRKPKIKPIKQEVKKTKNTIFPGKPNGESFLQDGPCCDVAPKLNRCRECRITNTRSKKMLNIFCRFFAFRKLKISKTATMANDGFADPNSVSKEDLKLWLPQPDDPPRDLDLSTSKFILTHVGNQFCGLVQQEQEANSVHLAEDKTIAWKRVVQGVREMCDVCETTLFNFHWACSKCGFVVCIDCYKARKNSNCKITDDDEQNCGRDRDIYSWLLCNNKQPHEQEKLMLTQIVAANVLWEVGKLVHSVRRRWNIPMHCSCVRNENERNIAPPSNGICKQLMNAVKHCLKNDETESSRSNGTTEEKSEKLLDADIVNGNNKREEEASSSLRWLADVALNSSSKIGEGTFELKSNDKTAADASEEHFSTLRELLIRPSGKNSTKSAQPPPIIQRKELNTLDDVINCMIEQSVNKQDEGATREDKRLRHYMRRYPQPRSGWDPLPVRIFTLSESRLLFPNVPHSWLCEGRLLRLHDPIHKNNLNLFQEQWKRGQPVLVSEVNRALDMTLWHPEAFASDFGDITNDLVNCHTGNIVADQPMRKFWEGFENLTKRMQDEHGVHMLLKLKDWPPGDDFSELLPSRFEDLMKALPLPEYTHRNGRLNLAGRLPDCFVRPDLGPKMYNAYGSALYPSKGTTNLHLDISDAVNVMVYVGIPRDGNSKQHIEEALKAIDEAGCDILTRRRVRERNERPGALWHIYNARDADKIRDLLNKVAVERGETLEAHHDPIHDQSWYLDAGLRERLYLEYAVEGYAIAQCLGDAVFIPAGAPHQVRNLHSCIKVAEDFVSPENVSHCFTLTQEFRDLSDTHTNHEDKLQVKNIIYHAVKDALSVLLGNEMKTANLVMK
uniref:[histone H3]-dimethyl-L-lysine(9) demethylase n=1 Tax=Strigamia maritima TaxID=126957 RepID=T1IIC8_STRMM